jgi:iron(III) transport system substrate-binding protein
VRVLICNTEKLADERDLPGSIFDLVDERWKGKVAMADPQFGTTATHCAALRAHKDMGREKTNDFLRRLVANDLQVVEGNKIVAMRVASGGALVGFTDTDDAWAMIDQGKPVRIVYPDGRLDEIGTLVVPNTASMIAGCGHPKAAGKFLDYLLSDRAEQMLAAPPARHLPTRQRVKAHGDATPLYMIRPMQVDWEKVADEVEAQVRDLEQIFPR